MLGVAEVDCCSPAFAGKGHGGLFQQTTSVGADDTALRAVVADHGMPATRLSWDDWLFRPVDNSRLAAFRIVFGVLLAIDLMEAWDWRVEMLSQRVIHFPYDGFSWIQLLPPWGAVLLQAVLVLACVFIAAGYWFRAASIVFFLGYTYSFLIDRAYFNNHFYLIVLFGGWLAVSNAHHRWSVDAAKGSVPKENLVPRWQIVGPAIQMAIPYFFGGIAKINADWLRGEPASNQIRALAEHGFYSSVVTQPWAGLAFAWAGLVFDLSIVPFLLWRKTRVLAITALLFFHLTNSIMFSIGIFPWLGIATTLLFLPDSWVSGLVRRLPLQRTTAARTVICTPVSPMRMRWIKCGFAVWLVVQCTLPLRHFLIPSNVGWAREGFYFAWTMKLNIKDYFLGFHICNPASGSCLAIDHDEDLTLYQQIWVPREPKGIVEYAKLLKQRAQAEGIANPVIVCDALCSLNGRPYQYLIDPAKDPSELCTSWFGHSPWIVPLDQAAPIGRYKHGLEKEKEVMAIIHDTRLKKGIFPEKLRGRRLRDITPDE